MNDRDTAASVRSSRRQFLQIGTGLAGSVSLAALLAACGAPATSDASEKQAAVLTLPLSLYLVIARYNREKWKSLSADERKDAEEAAEVLFPEKSEPLSDMKGVWLAHTSHRDTREDTIRLSYHVG